MIAEHLEIFAQQSDLTTLAFAVCQHSVSVCWAYGIHCPASWFFTAQFSDFEKFLMALLASPALFLLQFCQRFFNSLFFPPFSVLTRISNYPKIGSSHLLLSLDGKLSKSLPKRTQLINWAWLKTGVQDVFFKFVWKEVLTQFEKEKGNNAILKSRNAISSSM